LTVYETNTESTEPACRQAGTQRATEEDGFLSTGEKREKTEEKLKILLLLLFFIFPI
jgi:hypothetical protein